MSVIILKTVCPLLSHYIRCMIDETDLSHKRLCSLVVEVHETTYEMHDIVNLLIGIMNIASLSFLKSVTSCQ